MRGGGIKKDDIDLFDIGAGSGYFLSACDDLGIKAQGVDMSEVQVAYGNQFMHKKNGATLSYIHGTELEQTIRDKKGINIISAIGVLEHVVDYHRILSAIRENKTVQYLYMSVPMFGLSNVLETLLPDVFNRHLGGGHTHVFSESSIRFLCETYDMEMVAKWQFGTDMMDLYRMCLVKNNAGFGEVIHEKLYPCLDEMQLVLDKNGFSSEMHALFKFHK